MKKTASRRQAADLSPEQEEEAQRIYQGIKEKMSEELLAMARHMASKPTHKLFGEGEYELRDMLNEFGATFLQEAANERAKKGLPR